MLAIILRTKSRNSCMTSKNFVITCLRFLKPFVFCFSYEIFHSRLYKIFFSLSFVSIELVWSGNIAVSTFFLHFLTFVAKEKGKR